ncbi:hypothetical protein THASP1DRAFT_22687 [Thamnocephalis sphaerospora]|uniref:DUF7789 domain-containing protein n=1 Tax=Thamnocephalis sphaerospora TaxID=78915 RepID=A0A4P9XTH8_9FUNG|nr:hypothetical protein THASP1DRAFT_22687 [Thamnocephalis sphaerospora]|eukprot:RKP09478.1 hypothetical protein THASP1DRAFT_22687 [Thamnocephalis sphaerospora]
MVFSSKRDSALDSRFAGDLSSLPVGTKKGKGLKDRLLPESKIAKWMLAVCALQASATLALEIAITVFHLQQVQNANYTHRIIDGKDVGGTYMEARMKESESVIAYHYIFMSAQVFMLGVTWDALMRKNTLQLIGVCTFSCLSIAYAYIQSAQHDRMNMNDIEHLASMHHVFVHNTVAFEMAMIAVVAGGTIFMSALTWELYREFGWQIYKKLGADLQISRMYRLHQMTLTFLKFDAFFLLALPIQLVALSSRQFSGDIWYFNVAAIPFSILLICLVMFSLHKENKPSLILFLIGLLASIGYMIYKLVNIVQTEGREDDPYLASRKFLIFFVVVTLALSVVSFIFCVLCYNYYGRGLLEHRRQHKLGTVAAPVNATEEEIRRISLMSRNNPLTQRVELD